MDRILSTVWADKEICNQSFVLLSTRQSCISAVDLLARFVPSRIYRHPPPTGSNLTDAVRHPPIESGHVVSCTPLDGHPTASDDFFHRPTRSHARLPPSSQSLDPRGSQMGQHTAGISPPLSPSDDGKRGSIIVRPPDGSDDGVPDVYIFRSLEIKNLLASRKYNR